jgi:hypothetical protein
MKILKITALLVAIVCFVCLRQHERSFTFSQLKPVSLAAFSLHKEITTAEAKIIEQRISTAAGVTACKINAQGKIASVIYHEDVVTEPVLLNMLKSTALTDVKLKVFESTGGGCPIHQVGNSINAIISMLDLRK